METLAAVPAPPSVTEHSLYELHLADTSESPTRWLIQNAEDMPSRLLTLLQTRQQTIPVGAGRTTRGWLFAGVAGEEIVAVRDVAWDGPPDLVGAFTNENNLTRSLRVTFDITTADGRTQPMTRTIPNLPFPTPWGTFVTGANELLLSNKLVQKPGIFPVNLQEAGKPAPENNGILWHTSTASILQTESSIVAIVRSLTNSLRNDGGRNKAVKIPRAAWAEFDAALNEARSHNLPIDLAKYPQLVAAFKYTHRLGENTRLDQPLSSWIRELARASVPDGSWRKRMERIGGDAVAQVPQWSIAGSRAADELRSQLPQSAFIGFSDLGRLKVQTAADVLSEMLAQLIAARIQELASTAERRNQPVRSLINSLWNSTAWRVTDDLIAATQSSAAKTDVTLATEKSPAETAIRAVNVLREGHVFGQSDDISSKQREAEPASSQYFISAITMENTSVGHVLHLLPQTRVRASSGELEAPFVVRGPDPVDAGKVAERRLWLNSEELEQLEQDLAARGLGLAYGRPELMPGPDSTPANLHVRGELTARVPRGEIPAYFDAAPLDAAPPALALLPGMEGVDTARFPIALAFINGASLCRGSSPHPDMPAETLAAARKFLNSGKLATSPVAGIVESVDRTGRAGQVTVLADDGTRHTIRYPIDLTNAFSTATGMTCVKFIGERVELHEPLLAPDNTAIVNAVRSGQPGVFTAVPLRGAAFSKGEEDLLVVSEGTKASGRLTIVKQGTCAALDALSGPVRLAIIRPGTMILPGMVLGWEQVQSAEAGGAKTWREIRAGQEDVGVLTSVNVVPDETGRGYPVEVDPIALAERPSLARHGQELLAGVAAEFASIADQWKPEVKDFWLSEGADVTAPYETAVYYTRDPNAPSWDPEPHRLSLAGLRAGPGNAEYDQLLKDLQRAPSEVFFGYAAENNSIRRNFLETRLHYTHEHLGKIAERIAMPPPDEMATHAKRVVLTIMRELPIADGDKGAALGTKGSVAIIHPQNLPMALIAGEVAVPDVSFALLGHLARSSAGDMKEAARGQHAATLDSVVYDADRSTLIQVGVAYGTYWFNRQGGSDPGTAESSRGIPDPRLDLTGKGLRNPGGRLGGPADPILAGDMGPAFWRRGGRSDAGFNDPRQLERIRTTLRNELPFVSTVRSPAAVPPPPPPVSPTEPRQVEHADSPDFGR